MKNFQNQKKIFEEFADRLSVGILLVDVAGKCLFANAGWTKLSGILAEEALGDGWLSAIPTNSSPEFEKRFSIGLQTKQETEDEIQIITPDGIVKWLHLIVKPIFSGETNTPIFSVVVTEVTKKKGSEIDLKASEEKFENIINRASDMIYEVSVDGNFTFVNPVAKKILKYSKSDLLQKNFSDIVYPGHRKSVSKFYEKQLSEKISQTYLEFPVQTKNGDRIWVGQNVTLIDRNGVIAGLQGFAREITEQKLAERSLRIQDAVVGILADSESVGDAINDVLKSTLKILGWQAAAWWQYAEKPNGLNCGAFWKEDKYKFNRFKNVTEKLAFEFGQGIPGRVLESKKAIWIEELSSDSKFIRNEISKKDGIRSGFWFPVLLRNSVHGVFEFLSSRKEKCDEDLLQLMTNIGSQFGQFIQRKNAERDVIESNARKSAILESALDCVVTIDSEGRVLEFNPAAEETFGYKREEAVGELMGDLIVPPNFREAHRQGIKHYLKTGEHKVLGQRIEIVGMKKDGTEFPVELAITPIFQPDAMPVFTGYLRDITERKIAEEELKKAKDEAESASHAKSQFLAVMSHEIRTPLNAIIGMSDLAVETDSDSERIEFVEIVQENSENLLALINDILDISKIEAEQIDIESLEFNLGDLVESVVETFAFKAVTKGLELVCKISADLPETFIGDPNRLRQVLINLVSNAVKFTEKGEVFVKLDLVENDDKFSRIRISVKDSGIGIDADKIQTVFEKFNQADISTSRKYGGTGLGLSISQSLIKLMNGEIKVLSEIESGSEFSFSLDLPVLTRKNPYLWSDELADKNILVVENSPAALEAFDEIFKNFSGNVVSESDPENVIKLLDDRTFDAAFIDQTLKEIDGKDLSQLIKIKSQNTTKIILFENASGSKVDDSQQVDYIIKKPCYRKAVHLAMAELFNLPQSEIDSNSSTEAQLNETISARILLAEDSKANQELVVRILQKAGYEIDIASNGLEAVSKFTSNKYDLILMDIEMPEMDGFQATTEIRRIETKQQIPIIALTAHAIQGYREKCLSFGMNDYLTKPLRRKHLIKTISRILGENENPNPEEKTENSVVFVDEDILDLVDGYLESCKESVKEIAELLAKEDFENVKRIGHNLKGSGSGYGFEDISKFGKAIEDNAANTNLQPIIDAANDLEAYLNQVSVESK